MASHVRKHLSSTLNQEVFGMTVRKLSVLVLLFIAPVSSPAQSQSVDDIEREISDLKARSETLRGMESAPRVGPPKKVKLSREAKAALSPPDDLKLTYKDFLKQKNTGIAKLLSRRDKNDNLMVSAENPTAFIPLRSGGASYSFSKHRNDDEFVEEIRLDKDIDSYPPGQAFWVTGGGADFGFITKLGDVALEDVFLERKEAKFLVELVVPDKEPSAREYQRKSYSGFYTDGTFYRNRVVAEENATYLQRTISYGWADLVVAFRTVRKEPDGSFVILWKILKRNPTPILKGKTCYFGPCH